MGSILMDVLTLLLAFAMPAAVIHICRKYPRLDALGPVIILYALGIIAGLLGLKSGLQNIIANATIPVAIPLILFGNPINLTKKNTRDMVLAFVSCLVATMSAVAISYSIFHPGPEVAGMVSGCATGGTMNMASVKLALGADDATFVILNTYDMTVSSVYILCLLAFGIRLARKILPVRTVPVDVDNSAAEKSVKAKPVDYIVFLGWAALCCAAAYLVTLLFSEDVFMLVFILVITALGIGLSFVNRIKSRPGSYDMGMYLVYVFSFTVASMADFRNMSLSENASLLGFFACVIFISLALHMIFSWILKIDADTAVIASNAFVNAPPTVPVISSAMKNPAALTAGLTIGILGYAIGTYLGILVATVLG